MLYGADGRRLRRSIGFLPEYRVERDVPAGDLDLVGHREIEIEDDETDEAEDSGAARSPAP
jgi:hypothetical protein